jgi:hypothetical protein
LCAAAIFIATRNCDNLAQFLLPALASTGRSQHWKEEVMADEIPPHPMGELGAYLHLGLAAFSVIGMTVFASGNFVPPSKRVVPPEAAPQETLDPGRSRTQYARTLGICDVSGSDLNSYRHEKTRSQLLRVG